MDKNRNEDKNKKDATESGKDEQATSTTTMNQQDEEVANADTQKDGEGTGE